MTNASGGEFPRLRLAVSACLLGETVRYDGGHKRHPFLTGTLAACADYLPLCPEVAIGLGVPRPPIALSGDPARPRAVGVEDPSRDVTAALQQSAADSLDRLAGVSGYLFKKKSPSCGLRRVKVHTEGNAGRRTQRRGQGIFARAVRESLPLLPVAEEDSLDDPLQLEQFLCRVYVYRRWQDLCAGGLDADGLRAFHRAHRWLVRAQSRAAWTRLEQCLAALPARPLQAVAGDYIDELMTTLARPLVRARHEHVLQRLAERAAHRPEQQLAAWRRGELPLAAVRLGLREALAGGPPREPDEQYYLTPFPPGLLRHIAEMPVKIIKR